MPLLAARFQLVIAFEPNGLSVALWRKTGWGWKIGGIASLGASTDASAPDSPFPLLRAQLAQWGVPKGTPVVAVPAASIGGFIEIACPARRPADFPGWLDGELAKHLPFSAREVAWSWLAARQGAGKSIRIIWMPKAWVKELEIELARMGLPLKEIMPRALAAARYWDMPVAERAQWAVFEGGGDEAALHVFSGRMPRRSLQWVRSAPLEVAQRATAELAAVWDRAKGGGRVYCAGTSDAIAKHLATLPGIEIVTECPRRDLHDAILRAWREGEEGVWLPPEPAEIFRGIRRATFMILLVGVSLIGAVMWQAQDARKQIGTLETEIRKDKPKYQRVVATEAQLLSISKKLTLLAQIRDAVNPLDPLDELRKIVPEGAWLTHVDIRGEELLIEGRGAQARDVLARIEKSSAFSGSKIVNRPADAAADGDLFGITMRWRGVMPNAAPQ